MSNVNPEWAQFAWEVAVTLISLAAICVSLWASKNFVKRGEVEVKFTGVAESIDDHQTRLVSVENQLKHTPQREDIQRLSREIASLNEKLGTIQGAFQSQSNLLATIHDYLLNQK